MILAIDDDLRAICRDIIEKYDRLGISSLVYSDDEYQRGVFCGGWDPNTDSTHGAAFYFSYYAPDGGDYIFALSIDDVRVIANGGCVVPMLEYWKRSPLGPYRTT